MQLRARVRRSHAHAPVVCQIQNVGHRVRFEDEVARAGRPIDRVACLPARQEVHECSVGRWCVDRDGSLTSPPHVQQCLWVARSDSDSPQACQAEQVRGVVRIDREIPSDCFPVETKPIRAVRLKGKYEVILKRRIEEQLGSSGSVDVK